MSKRQSGNAILRFSGAGNGGTSACAVRSGKLGGANRTRGEQGIIAFLRGDGTIRTHTRLSNLSPETEAITVMVTHDKWVEDDPTYAPVPTDGQALGIVTRRIKRQIFSREKKGFELFAVIVR